MIPSHREVRGLRKPNRVERFAISPTVLQDTASWFQWHGAQREEGLVFWVGLLGVEQDALVTRCVHPAQVSTAVSVDVDDAANAQLQVELVQRGEFLWAQVHSHPGSAFHSGRDDRFPATHKPGYVSIVVPDFGQCDLLQFERCRVFEYQGSGHWREWAPREIQSRLSVEGLDGG